jgi:predicted TIM-barrel fold metal-dependent hydrolase
MKYWMGKGLTGMRFFTSGSTMPEQSTWFADPKTFPAWKYAGEAGLSVCMQMRMAGLPKLREILDRFPKVRVIVDHLARVELSDGPPYSAAAPLFELVRYSNIYLKLTHRPIEESRKGRSTSEQFFSRLVKEFGARRIAWGSNFPAAEDKLPALAALAKDALSFLPQQDQDWIFFKTAQTLYPALTDG